MATANRTVSAVVRWKEGQADAIRRQPENALSRAELLCDNALASLRRGDNAGKATAALEWLHADARVRRALEVGRHIPKMDAPYNLPSLAERFEKAEREGAETSGLRVELLANMMVSHREEDLRDIPEAAREKLHSAVDRASAGISAKEFVRAGFIALAELIRREDFEQADRVIKDCRLGPRQVGDAAIIGFIGRIHGNLVGQGMEGFMPLPVLPEPEVLKNLESSNPGCLERFGVGWLVMWSERSTESMCGLVPENG
ncbi:MAG: hypothetical protein AB1657_02305 [Candidatus Micrarchaeota archaeon]